MKLILCHSILKKEIKPLLEYFSRGDLKKVAMNASDGLCAKLKSTKIPDTQLVKVYMTGRGGAVRLVVLVYLGKDYYVPVVLRLKKDKLIGSNMSSMNRAFQNVLDKNLDLIVMDLKNGNFENIDL
jgi:hypothetical protein